MQQGNKKTKTPSVGILSTMHGEYTEEAKQRIKEAGHSVERVEKLTEYGDKIMLQIIEAGYKPSEALMIAGNLIIWVISNQAKSMEGATDIVADMAAGIVRSIAGIRFPEDEKKGGKA